MIKILKQYKKKQKVLQVEDTYLETVKVDSQKPNKLLTIKLSKKEQQVAAIKLGLFKNLNKTNTSLTTNNKSEIQKDNDHNANSSSEDESEKMDIDRETMGIKIDQYKSPDMSSNDIEQLSINNINVLSIKQKQNVLGKGYRSQIHSYARDQLFKRVKILEKSHLEIDGDIIKNCLAKIDSKSILSNKQLVLNSVRTEVTNTINARRGYVKKRVIESLKGMFSVCYI